MVAESFLERGSIVYICDVDAAALTEAAAAGDKAARTSEGTASDRGTLHGIEADVSSYEDVQRFFAQIQSEQGRLDILVNIFG